MHCIFAVRFSRGSLAQLVQSAALTGQRSLVRVQYDPPITRTKQVRVFCAQKSPIQGRKNSQRLPHFCRMDLKRLSDLTADEKGTLTRIDAPEGMLALMEMGCTVGEEIEVRHIAPLGDPMAVSAGGHLVTLRREQAHLMWVKLH